MTSSTGSISVSGLLGGTAGKIDVTSLISSLMTAAAVPQSQLKDQLSDLTTELTAYRSVNTKLTALQTAAQKLTTGTTWQSTAATSSNTSVVATSTTDAAVGSTTFDVTKLAAAQVSTIAAASDGTVVTDPTAGITITGADGKDHAISLTSGSAASVAAAINSANVGVRASVVNTDGGTVLQLASSKTGAANGFTTSGFDSSAKSVVDAADAQIKVGGSNGYTVSSSSNTFTGVITGVTFSVSSVASNVNVTVTRDASTISSAVKSLVDAANAAHTELDSDTAQGAVLQGRYDVRSIMSDLGSSVSRGTTTGASLKTYGIDIGQDGSFSFDATAFAAAYAADPTGTQTAVGNAFAKRLDTTSTAAVDSKVGSITQAMAGLTTTGTRLTSEISDWTSRLADIQSAMTAKYTTMQTALARLESQQTYLTSMFDSISGSSSSSSS
ncbi:flagellar hook-associated protein 2 [Jatrophihabitans endophyticus]|uniref:Flagellar hook-associated protein 2 n=1 Tax=Jatrophihabitans endophyticus TaxID=1206085 RepID=A0A1M5IEH8_9ACTN|nr:flagellar filament capping protein FliD [Jatrophihabitans endophyticus]SHG26676.1 flagellar hook-associated protein 2 [Jatrophihabitans endophyticus]